MSVCNSYFLLKKALWSNLVKNYFFLREMVRDNFCNSATVRSKFQSSSTLETTEFEINDSSSGSMNLSWSSMTVFLTNVVSIKSSLGLECWSIKSKIQISTVSRSSFWIYRLATPLGITKPFWDSNTTVFASSIDFTGPS